MRPMGSAERIARQRVATGATHPMDLIPEDPAYVPIASNVGLDAPVYVDDGAGGIVQTTAANQGGRPTMSEREAMARSAALEAIAGGELVPTINPESGELESVPHDAARAEGRIVVPRGEAVSAVSTQGIEDAQNAELERGLMARARPVGQRLPRPAPAPSPTARALRASVQGPAQVDDSAALERPPAASLSSPPPVQALDEYAAAQEAARQRRMIAGFGQAADLAAAAIGDNKPQTAFYERLSGEADMPVREYLATKQQRENDAKGRQEAELRDPMSGPSKRFQAYVTRALPGIYAPEEIAQMVAADAEQVLNMGQMRSTLEAREAEAEASRTASASENEAQRTFQAGESAKQRGLQRELAQMRQGDPGAKEDARVQKMESGLRKEFEALQPVKDYRNAKVSLDKVMEAAKQPGAMGSLALTFAVLKTIDPGSVVKETEKATVENARGTPESIRATWNRVLAGDNLTAEQRKEIVTMAAGQFRAYENSYNELADRYSGLATAGGGAPGRVAAPMQPQRTAPPTDAAGRMELGDEVTIIAPNGKPKLVPRADLQRYLDAGAKVTNG